MDPILDEMKRVKDPHDIKGSRFRDWVQYLCALVAAKNDKIAALEAQIERQAQIASEILIVDDAQPVLVKRGPCRPRKESAHVG